MLSATDSHWLQEVAIVLVAGGSFYDPSPGMPWPTSGLFNNNVNTVNIPGIDEDSHTNVGALASDLTCTHYIHPNSITQIAGSSWIEDGVTSLREGLFSSNFDGVKSVGEEEVLPNVGARERRIMTKWTPPIR